MKKLLPLAGLLFSLFFVNQAIAQDAPVHIAILPFTPSTYNARSVAKDVEGQVSNCFLKDRFYLLNRSEIDQLKKELNLSKTADFANSKIQAEPGHLVNAEYIITGVVDSVIYGATMAKDVVGQKSLDTKANYFKYHGTIHVLVEVIKVETGRIVKSQPFIITSREFDEKSDALINDNALCRLRNDVQTMVRDFFPPVMTIVSIDKTNKKGLPDVVLVNGGTEIFDSGKVAILCPGDEEVISVASKTSAVGSLLKKAKGALGSNRMTLDVVLHEDVPVGDKILKRDRKIGELRFMSNEDQVTDCSVEKGAEDIKSNLDAKKTLYVKVQKKE